MLTRVLISGVALLAGAAGVALSPADHVPRSSASRAAPGNAAIPVTRLLGQRIMVGMDGTFPSTRLLSDVRQGRVGSVILFAANIVNRAQTRALTGALQRAARAGGNPRLLIATDQEGGQVKRLPYGPPDLSPPQIAATGSAAKAFSEGRATGRYLKNVGINWDLAPVLDVPTSARAFIWRQARAFSFSAGTVARFGTEFALGLQSAGAAATGKHFPGVGSAAVDTDNQLNVLRPGPRRRMAALLPYRSAIARGLESVMLSTAAFPAYDRRVRPSALSAPIAQGLLREKLGFRGVTITDALGAPTGHDEVAAGVLAAQAGSDVLLYTDSAQGVLSALLRALRRGSLSDREARFAYARILALKQAVG